ncbi:MAG: hypothetical protein ACOYN4_00845 [Bacteroidales bacterium]
MNKITLHLSYSEWQMLAAIVCSESIFASEIEDKYMKAILYPLLKQVYVKLHNKLHSLNVKKNSLNLTLPEASALGLTLLESSVTSYLITHVTSLIDQKLT